MAQNLRIIGGGPAGTAAAIQACREGAAVTLFEKSIFPRHKVCGEFLSPESARIFSELGILEPFLALQPYRVREANVFVGRATKRWKLSEPAFGISRYAMDQFLMQQAVTAGATVIREAAPLGKPGPVVVARGRQNKSPAGDRLFGFKAHFSGPVTDRIDLLFDRDMYVGINSVETGATNVCALASESLLKRFHFEPDALLASFPRLTARLNPLTRHMDWLITGPLVYGGKFDAASAPDVYLAGDALGFVDPFTGSGMLGALATGFLAGRSAARTIGAAQHLVNCKRVLRSQYQAAALFRKLIEWGVADKLTWLLPGDQLFRLTRPSVNHAF